ncbi:hypothetical protein P691DRAFT_707861 [Macrolepiota fuliginosa MF-IS2]|uniref:Protein kinase domain-containing protein n=1 Tax=Macrolepiota fuliginosa MF-IS2 TaxID=1400762 RepID=A0A9P6C2T1_9AGAR|nr:hypothetical protein P691DRAFT_707861 [Macrolepiota fuliginosa MF-IS2]
MHPDIMKEMADEMHECPLEAFLEEYTPFRPSQRSIDAAYQHYVENTGMLEKDHDSFVWADFSPRPSSAGQGEDKLFAHLKPIIDELRQLECFEEGVDGQARKPQYNYKSCPNQETAGEITGTGFRVDACITSKPASDVIVLADTAAVLEFKKFAKDTHKNREQLVSGAGQIMNDDPRRTWIYGITIEDTMMSVWYFCRSHSVKSDAFDFTVDIKSFIQVFMSLLFATPKEIGYDPTVHRVTYNKCFHYVYKLSTNEGKKYFRTLEPLFNLRVLCITGRKTRVWRAIEVCGPEDLDAKDGALEVAVKDVWLDADSATEKEKQEKIFAALGKAKESDYDWAPESLHQHLNQVFKSNQYRDYFMEIKYDTVLSHTKSLSESAKRAPNILHHIDFAITSGNVIEGSTQAKTPSAIAGSSIRPHGKPKFFRQYRDKKHYRLIYGEVGHSLYKAVNLDTSFTAIRDVFVALVLLYLARWLHRDVSPGNIILIGQGNEIRGKLSDLEYAKEFNTTTNSGDPKTGTPFFMAVEVHDSRSLLFLPQEKFLSINPTPNPFRSGARRPSRMAPGTLPVTPSPPTVPQLQVQARFQHDLESLWWIILWILLCRIKDPDTSAFTQTIFTFDHMPTRERLGLFTLPTFTSTLEGFIHPELRPSVTYLNNIRTTLYNSYINRQKFEERFDPRSYADIYHSVCDDLWCLIDQVWSLSDTIALDDGFRKAKPVHVIRPKRSRALTGDEDSFELDEDDVQEPAHPNKRSKVRR